MIVFVNVYGGVEHDSGWSLGVARSLAEKGTYTTMVSSIPDPTVIAGHDIYNQFEVQDKDGSVYFRVEGNVGPARVIPDALMLKLFGNGFWQFRAASLLFYLMFLILGSWLLLSTGGLLAALFFHAFLFFYPQLSIFLGYEALGEMPAMAYILLAFALYLKASKSESRRTLWFFLTGLAAGLAIVTKLISLLPLTSLGILWLIWYFQKRTTFKEGLVIALGGIFFPLTWELTHLIVIGNRFGFEIYTQHAQQRFQIFLTNGSGLAEQASGGSEFFWYKLLLVSEISHPNKVLSTLTLVVIAASGPFLIWRFKGIQQSQNLVILLWSSWLVHTIWFVAASEAGWVRHNWFALILAALMLSLLWSNLLHNVKMPPIWFNLATTIAVTILICLNFYSQRHAATFFVSDVLIENWYQKHLAADHTRIPWILTPRQAQQDAVDFIAQLPTSARIFYPEGHKTAEMAVLTGRIFYPIERRPLMPPAKDDFVIAGPSLISPWAKLMEKSMQQAERQGLINEVVKRIKRECPRITFENNYYIVCAVD